MKTIKRIIRNYKYSYIYIYNQVYTCIEAVYRADMYTHVGVWTVICFWGNCTQQTKLTAIHFA